MSNFHPVAASDCQEANDHIEAVYSDPMTQHYGCGGDAAELWLLKHIKTCKKCEQATIEGNMP